MPIYQLFDQEKKQTFTETFEAGDAPEQMRTKGRFFSSLVTRLCFFLLLIADGAWFAYTLITTVLAFFGMLITFGKIAIFKNFLRKSLLNFRRSIVCALALFVGLFSPPFGIMVACTYFLMYDKAGMEQVVHAPLQAQFKDIFKT